MDISNRCKLQNLYLFEADGPTVLDTFYDPTGVLEIAYSVDTPVTCSPDRGLSCTGGLNSLYTTITVTPLPVSISRSTLSCLIFTKTFLSSRHYRYTGVRIKYEDMLVLVLC